MDPTLPAPPSSTPPPSDPSASGPRSGPNTRLIAIVAGAVVVVAAVVVAVFVLGGDDDEPGPGASPSASASGSPESPSPSPSESPAAPEATTVTNSTAIAFVDEAASSSYPSVIEVAGFGGTVGDVSVTLHGLSHEFPDDVDVLLVGPGGQAVGLMNDVGGGDEVTELEITFDDEASSFLADEDPLASGVVVPSLGVGGAGTCCGFQGIAPAPAPPYETTLSVFDGTDPNGEWSLYVFDDASGDTGSLSGGWSLRVAPPGAAEPTGATGPTGPTGATGATEVVLEADFSDPSSGWEVFDTPDGAASYSLGLYQVEIKQPGRTTGAVRFREFPDLGDVHMAVTGTPITDVDGVFYGLLCRVQDADTYYFLHVSTDGRYQIGRNDGPGAPEFLDTGTTDALDEGTFPINRIEIDCVGGADGGPVALRLIVNGIDVSDVVDIQGLSGTGGIGIQVGTEANAPATVTFDDLVVEAV